MSSDRYPLVSVIIPAYNAAPYIGEAVDSALDQDYPHKEIIVINDGSTDETAAVLRGYGERIRLVEQANRGAAAARNRGLELARGEYIAFLDGDDIWLPGKLTAQVGYMERTPDVAMTYGRWDYWYRQKKDGAFSMPVAYTTLPGADFNDPPVMVPGHSGWLYHRLLIEFLIWTSVVMIRRSLADRVGQFDGRFKRGQDFEYWVRASRETEIHMLDRPMALYRLHRDSATYGCPPRNYAAEIIEQSLERWGRTSPDGSEAKPAVLRRHVSGLWHGYGSKQLQAGLPGRALGSFARSLRYQPWSLKAWIMMGVSVLAAFRLIRPRQTRPVRG